MIHKFRHRTLTLLKLMLLQKKIMFFGYPVERLCTYQYTLVSLDSPSPLSPPELTHSGFVWPSSGLRSL